MSSEIDSKKDELINTTREIIEGVLTEKESSEPFIKIKSSFLVNFQGMLDAKTTIWFYLALKSRRNNYEWLGYLAEIRQILAFDRSTFNRAYQQLIVLGLLVELPLPLDRSRLNRVHLLVLPPEMGTFDGFTQEAIDRTIESTLTMSKNKNV